MGGLASAFRRHEHRQPAICTVDVLAQEGQQQQQQQPAVCAVDALVQQEQQQHGVCAVDALAEQEQHQTEAPHDDTDERGQTPLHRAAEAGDTEAMRWLLSSGGADVAARDRSGRTALHAAAETQTQTEAGGGGRGGADAVELLLRHGADAGARDGCGRTALHCALQAANLATAEALLAAACGDAGPPQPPMPDDTGRTELHWAAVNGTPEAVRQLAARGSVEGRDGLGMTPLSRALQARNRGAAAALLQLLPPPPPPDAEDAFGRTELHWAAYAGYPEVVRCLLERGLWPWAADLCGRDALMWAAESGEPEAVGAVLEGGGFRERADGCGQTALHLAAARGDAAIAARLLECGADADRGDSGGRTALVFALAGGHREAAVLLAERGGTSVDVRRRDSDRRTLLHWAAVGGDAGAVRALLARGARVNALDARRESAVALALRHGREAAAEALVAADGFRVARDRRGRTPLHGAAAAGWPQVAARLVSLGADPHQGDNQCLSPVTLAIRAGHFTLARAISRSKQYSRYLRPDRSDEV